VGNKLNAEVDGTSNGFDAKRLGGRRRNREMTFTIAVAGEEDLMKSEIVKYSF